MDIGHDYHGMGHNRRSGRARAPNPDGSGARGMADRVKRRTNKQLCALHNKPQRHFLSSSLSLPLSLSLTLLFPGAFPPKFLFPDAMTLLSPLPRHGRGWHRNHQRGRGREGAGGGIRTPKS